MSTVLVTYASKHGSTKEIAEKVGGVIQNVGLEVSILPIKAVKDTSAYQAVILGVALYIGQWRKEAVNFLKNNEKALINLPLWIFSSGPTGEGDPAELLKGFTLPEALKPLITRLQPKGMVIFHGNLDPEKISGLEKFLVTNVKAPMGDFRDWQMIVAWAESIASTLKAP